MIDIILASKSKIRKIMMEDAKIPFEVIVSNADETPNENFSFEEELKDISMRKATAVLKITQNRGKRIIVAADQNIVFDGVMYGKPKSIEESRELIKKMYGRNDIYAYVGNSIIYADGNSIISSINNCDISRMRMDYIPKEELEEYLSNGAPLTKCGGISIYDMPFLHLEDGKMSTALGMTIEYLKEMLDTL